MGKGTLTIYNASAGSGKTYTLAAVYLSHIFKSRHNYRRILAVTFTNKATAEMKSRILENLYRLGSGQKSDYLDDLIRSTAKTEEWIRSEAKIIMNSILHDYSRFSVSTIDSFFQKILRAFTREAGLHSGFNIEMDHSMILSSAVDEMIRSAGSDQQLQSWLTSYAMSNIEEEKSWNLKDGIMSLSEELFREKFKVLSPNERAMLGNKEFLSDYIKQLKSVSSSFERAIRQFGTRADSLFSEFRLEDSMFFQKAKGIPAFIKALLSGTAREPNSYVLEITKDNPKWSTGKPDPSLQMAIDAGLGTVLLEAIKFLKENLSEYRSAEAILSNIYSLGILSDVLKNIHEITTSENSFLLSDAGEVLNLITAGDQTSFIYEKAGNRYENFMIDEFQDTSVIQWNNFRPLIENSMAEGFDNLVVGDVKQSIYRWRNSDWRILGSVLSSMVDNDRIIGKPLTTNWRSYSDIIRFNNSIFTIIPEQIDELLSGGSFPVSFRKLYSEAVQKDAGRRKGGYVRLEFIENSREEPWKEVVLGKLPGVISSLLKKGYKPSDIGIIVRDGREGSSVLKALINFNNLPSDERQCEEFRVVSNDSLLLGNAPVLKFVIAVLSVVNDPSDMISRALMLRFFLLSGGDERADTISLVSSEIIEETGKFFPEGYNEFLVSLCYLPLFEATENIISFFSLGSVIWNVPYLNTFQDHVLNYSGTRTNDITSFLEWWEITGSRKSVVLPDNQDAVRILTIHKSKGLEFRIVILPFISWDLDHLPSKPPVLWVKPAAQPFNKIGIVPVKYSKELLNTIFADDYTDERYSVFIDNINLLYVAFTRAKEALIGFSTGNPRNENTIASVLKNALSKRPLENTPVESDLNKYYDAATGIFELGELSVEVRDKVPHKHKNYPAYHVSRETESLRLKLHGEYYFPVGEGGFREKINYGKLMHEVFEGIDTIEDVSHSVRKLVLEGKIPAIEADDAEKRIKSLIASPQVAEWFSPENKVMRETGILLPSGVQRRPDRVIFRNGRTIIVDFKFGVQNSHYIRQIGHYRNLLSEMGFENIEAFIWYVDSNLIEKA